MAARTNWWGLASVVLVAASLATACRAQRVGSGEPATVLRQSTTIVSTASSAGDLTPLQVQYEALHNKVAPVVDQVPAQLSHLSAATATASLAGIVDPFIMTLARFDGRVLTLPWPPGNLPDAKTAAATGMTMANDLLALGRATPADRGALVSKVLADDARFDLALNTLTSELHLPPGE